MTREPMMDITVEDILAEDVLPALMSDEKWVVPFPQANSVDCILQLLLNTEIEGTTLSTYIVANVVNSNRQAQYYAAAAVYLGLCRKIGVLYYPTAEGMQIQKAFEPERSQKLAAYMLSHSVIGRWYTKVFLKHTMNERLALIQTGFKTDLSEVTMQRRSQCLLSWMAWIQNHLPSL